MTLEVRVDLFGSDGTRLGINERVEMGELSFGDLARLLEAFHLIAEAIKLGRKLDIDGMSFFGNREPTSGFTSSMAVGPLSP